MKTFRSALDFDTGFEKQPFEQLTIRAELANIASNLVIPGYVLSSAQVSIFDSNGLDVSLIMISGFPSIDAVNNYVFVTIIAGNDGEEYLARIRTTWTLSLQPNQIIETDLLVKVRQKTILGNEWKGGMRSESPDS